MFSMKWINSLWSILLEIGFAFSLILFLTGIIYLLAIYL